MRDCCAFQDQKQTDSIQVLQSQLENVTKLMLNLTATVGQLQKEVTYCTSISDCCCVTCSIYSDYRFTQSVHNICLLF